MSRIDITRLEWEDPVLGTVDLPSRKLVLKAGFGSGLTRRRGDPPGVIWAIGDRGPNLKLKEAAAYGWDAPASLDGLDDAKIMPRRDLGPALAQLRVTGDRVTLVTSHPLKDAGGGMVSGLPPAVGAHAQREPALDLAGEILEPDPSGLDTEGLAALAEGGFWASEEYGPSLVRLDGQGQVILRLVPEGLDLAGAAYPVEARLPAIAARRQLNRGFEALALSPSEARLFVAFQSPLAHPDEETHAKARHVRIWQMDRDGRVEAQFLYPLDPPSTFRRDLAAGEVRCGDLKICEMVAIDEDRLLVLERGSETTKIFRVTLDPSLEIVPEHLAADEVPTLESLSAAGSALPALGKELLFTSDDHPQVGADMEGMVMLDENSLLIVSDNDFGVGEKESQFFRLDFFDPLA